MYFVEINIYKENGNKYTNSELAYKKLDELLASHGVYNRCLFRNKNGKPYCKKKVYFNISYSNNIFVIAISNREIGIDVEEIRTCMSSGLIIKRFFSKNEQEYINNGDKDKERRFFELWTKKEAYVKYTGKGIGKDFKETDVIIRNNDVEINSFFFNGTVISYCSQNKKKHVTIKCY